MKKKTKQKIKKKEVKSFFRKKEPIRPTLKEKKFIETLEGQIMNQILKSIERKNFIEAYIFSWATIEQAMIPRLIKFVAERLKIKLSKSIWASNQFIINQIYYCISHDKDLFNKLEKGRKLRNKIIHKMYTHDKLSSIKKEALKGIKHNHAKLMPSILDRLHGKVIIPSLTIYVKGWNDALKKAIEKIKKTE